jgi:hypothetical protein
MLLMLAPAGIAYAWSSYTYFQGWLGSGGSADTPGYDARAFNRVWHPMSSFFCAAYLHTNGAGDYMACGWQNPVELGADYYARARCINLDWWAANATCLTTRP